MTARYAQTNLHLHENGEQALNSATQRERNTTIVIGVDQQDGILLVDIDTQADICSGVAELQDHLRLIIEALDGDKLP
jgi:hypothetical protein